MFGRNKSLWLKLAFTAIVAVLTLTVTSGVLGASGCKPIKGDFTLQPLPPAACNSPVTICTTGRLTGDLQGTFAFTGTSNTPTIDSGITGVVVLTGDNTITTHRGTLQMKDAIVFRNGGKGDFAEVDTIVGGTGKLTGATGFLNATGFFDFVKGGRATYTGEICGV